ncbi:MAG TPA: GspE/PulE family protein [Candidatus Paceibacterota bacterium]|nr:GspE/PulE family protein [Candidatus Paceibacterota bacterium]
MSVPFDTKAEDEKLHALHEAEEEDVAQLLAQKYGLEYANLVASPIDMDALRLIPEEKARAALAVAFRKDGPQLALALAQPNNELVNGLVEELGSRGLKVTQYLVTKRSFEHALERYKELSYASASQKGVFSISEAELQKLASSVTGIPALQQYLSATLTDKHTAEVSRLFEGIMGTAFAMKASDIHIEPEETEVRLRFRLDGVLTDVFTFDAHTYRFLASRIKLLSGLKLNVHDRAQDGRFSVLVGGTEIEIRTSLIPGNYGESFVMRLLDPRSIRIPFESLGIHPKLLARLEKEITRPNGMLLTTGPTGSGKTTTLYAFLQKIQTPDIKIITIEDPVEYHLQGIVQTQTNGKDYTFASGLRSIVRQDPDVIMVGEIRDGETAGIAIQAALTGHFVFSTIHTNDAAGTFPRLVDLDADPKEFASAITVAMAQRLVRKLDPDARKEVPLEGENKKLVEKILASVVDKTLLPAKTDTLWVPDPKDGSNGYKGRVGLYEAIFMDDQLGTFLRDNPSAADIRKEVARQGYLTMAQDGVIKALQGLTSLEEVLDIVDIQRD